MAVQSILRNYESCPKYLVEVFVCPGTKELVPPDNATGWGQDHMLGLYGLFAPQAVSRITMTNTGKEHVKGMKKPRITEAFCGFCQYSVGNHISINNHLWMHVCLALLCHLGSCFHIEVSANDMWSHGKKAHSIEKGKPDIKSNKPTVRVHEG